jgi:hypothetical protein
MAVASVPAAYVAPAPAVQQETVQPRTAAEQKQLDENNKHGAEWWSVAVCIGLLAASALIAWVKAPDLGGWSPATPAGGLDTFALFYVAAFVLERLLEPMASIESWTPAKHERERDCHLRLARTARGRVAQGRALDDAAMAQASVDRWRASRALIVLGVATLAGVWISLVFELDFLSVVGVGFEKNRVWLHVFATALVIGGGTKPLHDLITRIQKAKDNAKDPKDVGGNA